MDEAAKRDGWRNGWRVAGWGAALALLALPAVAMQFSDEVLWGPGDFIVVGGLLAMLGGGIELAVRAITTQRGRLLAIAGLFVVFLLVWAELAVGIFH